MSVSATFRLAALAAFLLPLAPVAAQTPPTIHLIVEQPILEPDSGTAPLEFTAVLSGATTVDVQATFQVFAGSALAGQDFIDPGPLEIVIPAGQTWVHVPVQVVGDLIPEGEEDVTAFLTDVVGAVPLVQTEPPRGRILDNDPEAPQTYLAIDDRFVVAENTTMSPLQVLGNDRLFGTFDGTLTVLANPTHGTATVRNDIGPQYVEYRPDADFSGIDGFSYRYCVMRDGDEICDEGDARILLRPLADVQITAALASGYMDVMVGDLRALPGARFVATPLVAPEVLAFDNSVDPTPSTPWDDFAGTTWDVRTLPAPAAGETATRLVVDEPFGEQQAVIVGVDVDGDGQPSVGERGCYSAQGTSRCELRIPREPGASVNYWVLVHNLDDGRRDGVVHLYAVPVVDGDGSLHATGAGHAARGEDFSLRLAYRDDTLRDGGRRLGYVTVYSDAGTVAGVFPVLVVLSANGEPVQTAVPLVQGRPHAFALGAGESHVLTFIDVPAGATRLRVTSQSDRNVDLYLIWSDTGIGSTDTDVPPSPSTTLARVAATGPTGNEVAEVTSSVGAGRWYATVRNASAEAATYTLTAQIDASAPIVRDGSYFNPDRSGSGLFLYPAADQWTGLWYTYLQDGTPTWYYLQAPQPGADGVWNSAIHRSAWDGDSNVLVAVGDATVTPIGADRFRFSYRIDGVAGTQVFGSFGRGCPLGGAIDVSGTWFDPVRAGSGYSVQMFPSYEYYAAYYYDDQGYARFVAAEMGLFGGTEAELVIQQLDGDCPVCSWTGLPERTDIGVLRRRLLSGTFQYIDTDLEFVAPLSGGWTVTDSVQPLGGDDTTQGCAL